MMEALVAPILISFFCFGAGAALVASKLPELPTGPVATAAFFVVCGLLGAALSLVGIEIYLIVYSIENAPDGIDNAEIVATGIRNILIYPGLLVGLAGIVYLLAARHDKLSALAEPGD